MTFSHRMVTSLLPCLFVLGCSTPQSPPSPQPSSPVAAVTGSPAASHDHEEDHHDHDDHHHKAPHGGGLTALGEEAAHLEVALDPSTGLVDVYLLDGEAEQAQRTDRRQELLLKITEPSPTELTLKPVADTLSGETEESTSRFSATAAELKGKQRLRGMIAVVELKGQSYRDILVDFPTGIPEHSDQH